MSDGQQVGLTGANASEEPGMGCSTLTSACGRARSRAVPARFHTTSPMQIVDGAAVLSVLDILERIANEQAALGSRVVSRQQIA